MKDELAMTSEFCEKYVKACGDDLALPATYCDEHVDGDNEYWSYPLDVEGEQAAAGQQRGGAV